MSDMQMPDGGKSKAELKRERRELQEAQRAAKLASRKSAPEQNFVVEKKATVQQETVSETKSASQQGNIKKESKSLISAKNDAKISRQKSGKLSVNSKESETAGDSSIPASTKPAIGSGAKQGKGSGHALGVMRMDDPSHLKHSIRYLQKNKLQPRLQEPVRVNLFNHLSQPDKRVDVLGDLSLGQQASIHPAFLSLGIDMDEGRISGSNQRCLEFLRAAVSLINSYPWSEHLTDLPATASFSRSFVPVLVRHVTFLDQCRPLSVTIRNAVQYLKQVLSQLDSVTSGEEARTGLLEAVNLFVTDRIKLAGDAISALVIDSIRAGECICTYGYSSLVDKALIRAWTGDSSTSPDDGNMKKSPAPPKPGCLFSVLVVDSRPRFSGRKMFFQLRKAGIPCELTHIAALPMFAPKITLTLLGAHSLLSNGYVIASVGTAQVANIVASVAHTPVLVCAETYKFWERAQSDAFEFNELGDPDDIWRGPRGIHEDWRQGLPEYSSSSDRYCADSDYVESLSSEFSKFEFSAKDSVTGSKPVDMHNLANWRQRSNLLLLNLAYDVLPPHLVTAVMTELGILPTTSVPVVLRVKQSAVDAEIVV